ncbi:MauE/DoxX family redox-associated membrane protein [Intrasporangium sp.]|uniref:MauE/DoxX family redox-associated membrane protein n=1 Tax=Intrasporangium sp. TaxID=1925024 RepID=UPI003464AF73
MQIAVGVTFVYSGAAKLRVGRFALDLADYELLPVRLVQPLAAGLPWVEILLGALMLVGVGGVLPLWCALILLAAFALAISINLRRGYRNACGCQGSTKPIDWSLASRNVVLATSLAVAALSGTPLPGLRALAGAHPELSAGAAVAAVTVLLLTWVAGRLAQSVHEFSRQLRRSRIPTFVGGDR